MRSFFWQRGVPLCLSDMQGGCYHGVVIWFMITLSDEPEDCIIIPLLYIWGKIHF
jgi:hypothetical protein